MRSPAGVITHCTACRVMQGKAPEAMPKLAPGIVILDTGYGKIRLVDLMGCRKRAPALAALYWLHG